jgi:UPF0288 family protein (methanogenesis marker protein 3)
MLLVIQQHKGNNIIKMSTARIEYRKYKSISKEKHKIQPKDKENCNDRMTIYIVSTVGIHKEKLYISPETRTSTASKLNTL